MTATEQAIRWEICKLKTTKMFLNELFYGIMTAEQIERIARSVFTIDELLLDNKKRERGKGVKRCPFTFHTFMGWRGV